MVGGHYTFCFEKIMGNTWSELSDEDETSDKNITQNGTKMFKAVFLAMGNSMMD